MQGFISSLLSRYENTTTAATEVSRSSSIDEDDEFRCADQIQNSGFCVVKCDFNPDIGEYKNVPGLLKISKAEKLVILQNDFGSGWTCVRNQQTFKTGFVPTRHLSISL